jgi:uncharacterized membrane protein HdeD (DUF308 family)
MATSSASTSHAEGLAPEGRNSAMSAVLAQNWWAIALRGVFAILFGLIALFSPGATLLSLALLFAAYLIVDGICGIVAAIRAAGRHERWGILLLEGALNIVMGLVAALFPVGAVLAFVWVTAGWSIVTGILMIVAALKLAPAYGRGWLIFSGIVSVLFGLALAFSPIVGAVVLTWWLGAYALVFGITLLVLAFKLRGQRNAGPTTAGTAMPHGV